MKTKNLKAKASVLIANYNNAAFIDQCINSILDQNYKNIEIIFVDDNSSDNSIKVVKKYLKKVKLIKKKKKLGIGCFDQIASFQEAYKKSTGDVIFFLDSDDYFHKKKIFTFMKKFDSNKNIEILFDFPIKKFDKKKILEKSIQKNYNSYWPYIFPTSCIAVKKQKIKDIFNQCKFKKFPNIWLDFRVCVFAKHILNQYNFLDKNLTYYRQTENNISSKFKHLSVNWWKRRMQAHNYIKFFFHKKKIKYQANLDYFLTYFINFFIK